MMREESIMWSYMGEEQAVLERLLRSPGPARVAEAEMKEVDVLYFVAHGSSWNAAVTARDFLAKAGGLRVQVDTPGGFLYQSASLEQEKRERVLTVFISQTGTSRGVLEALQWASVRGYRTLGITAEEASPLADRADCTLLLECGREESNAKTKGYSATLLVLLLLALEAGRVRGTMEENCRRVFRRELEEQTRQIGEVVEQVKDWRQKTGFGRDMKELFVLGYGMNFGTAVEGQLKLLETRCCPAMFSELVEFSHGMHRAVSAVSSLVLIQTSHPLWRLGEETYRYFREEAGEILVLDASGHGEEGEGGDEKERIRIPAFPWSQSVLLLTAAIQALSAAIPESRGLDPNRDSHNGFTEAAGTRIERK